MTTWATAGGVSLLAHGVHYAVTVGGIIGVLALLLPQMFERHRHAPALPRDEHELRVAHLRASLAAGTVTDTQTLVRPTVVRATPSGAPADRSLLLLPLAMVSSTAAAGVHAAVGPAHFEAGLLFGSFFALASVTQLAWTPLVLRRPSTGLLLAGAAGNLGVLGLWAATRAWGLPGGLMPSPEAVGPWDLACGGWELVTAVACLALVHRGATHPTVAAWTGWHPAARAWLVGSVVLLGLLSVSGARS